MILIFTDIFDNGAIVIKWKSSIVHKLYWDNRKSHAKKEVESLPHDIYKIIEINQRPNYKRKNSKILKGKFKHKSFLFWIRQ